MRGGTVNTDFLTEKSEIHAWGEESARAAIETASASERRVAVVLCHLMSSA